ncbi:hypothetical protein [Halorubrum tropicale]|uniref:hypothetical protein n=1 Tax=Halorubrum tropicale TaxID=1765655 RepID=UPI0014309FFB|nr:hypothetical protein [Halorubrum tropicale]
MDSSKQICSSPLPAFSELFIDAHLDMAREVDLAPAGVLIEIAEAAANVTR